MSRNSRELALIAAAQAMKSRKRAQCSLHLPLNVFDLCERLGVSVFFQDIPSMEGIYHVFKHGTQWDELIEDASEPGRFDPDEFQADVFSACLQMPKIAVTHALASRKLNPGKCRPEDVFAVSTYFGISFGAFVTHLERTLNLIGTPTKSDVQPLANEIAAFRDSGERKPS